MALSQRLLTLTGLLALSLLLSACSNGGKLTLEPGATPNKDTTKSSPFVRLNQGGKALVVESGHTAANGVHGWISVQGMSSKTITEASGSTIILNKTQETH